jgi:hypothetical protein
MYGSTGSGQDVGQFETFTYEEMKAAVYAAHAFGQAYRDPTAMGLPAPAMPCGREPIHWRMRATWTTPPLPT